MRAGLSVLSGEVILSFSFLTHLSRGSTVKGKYLLSYKGTPVWKAFIFQENRQKVTKFLPFYTFVKWQKTQGCTNTVFHNPFLTGNW